VNKALLMGLVTQLPRESAGMVAFEVGVPQERLGRQWLQRATVIAGGHIANDARALRPAQWIFAEGRLTVRDGLPLVEAVTLFTIADEPSPPADKWAPERTHASPRPHDRIGYPRRLYAGTPRERIVWVRPTTVRPHASSTAGRLHSHNGPTPALQRVSGVGYRLATH
jgi:hypothetical protein